MPALNILMNDRDSLNYLLEFIVKDSICNLTQTCKTLNNITKHIPFKTMILDWTFNFGHIKRLMNYSATLEHLIIKNIHDRIFTDNLLVYFPRLKSLSLENCIVSNEVLKKYRNTSIKLSTEKCIVVKC